MGYDHKKIESKWQKYWEQEQVFYVNEKSKKPKFYMLDMFAYPSGEGLHVGHPRGYTASDILAKYYMMQGHNVLHPFGWDAFGLPAENYAIKIGTHPRETTSKNIKNFKRQLISFGFGYDWSREINTSTPEYYKWTQWVFKILYDNGLAYQKKSYVNWCPKDKTVLANEQVVQGCCERCGTSVEQKKMNQWFFKITDFAEDLINGLDKLDWPESTKEMQKNWIGRSEGAEIQFSIANSQLSIKVFTTRPDTLFGATYMVLAPEHELVMGIVSKEQKKKVEKYVADARKKSALDRTATKEKNGVFTGAYAINPGNNEKIPIWIADYVLANYGFGAVMAVPAHDERDFEFAVKYKLPITQVIAPLYSTKEGEDAVREDKETGRRKMVTVIIKHWKEDKVFCLDWEKFGWKSFILGGVEKGETFEEAAIREAKEESGYQNIKSIKKMGFEIHSNFFARHKDINRYSMSECFVIELADGKISELEEEHTQHHKGHWIDTKKLLEYVNLPNNLYYADIFLNGDKAFTGNGVIINSDKFNDLDSEEAFSKITKQVGGKITVQYKLHDWLVSRQRYWGAPIPIIYKNDKPVSVDESDLPVLLPTDVDFKPGGESPLVASKEFHKDFKREVDTLDTFVCSSWYFLRYCDPNNTSEFVGKKSLKYWMPVDYYIGGAEHTNGHLLYSRFIVKALNKLGYLDFDEPFLRLRHQGMIQGEDGEKMSKSRGNVVNPDDVIGQYGADTMRMYEMFIGPFDMSMPWDTKGIVGIKRFLDRTWNKLEKPITGKSDDGDMHRLIQKVTEDLEQEKFNTAISAMMAFINDAKGKDWVGDFAKLLSPFAPHISEELWQTVLKNKGSVFNELWPKFDIKKVKLQTVTIAVQEKGKTRGTVIVASDASEKDVLDMINKDERLGEIAKKYKKNIFVKNRIINFVE